MNDQLLSAEIHDVLRTMPSQLALTDGTPEALSWIGRATSVLRAWDSVRAMPMDRHVTNMQNSNLRYADSGYRGVVTLLHEAQHDLRMRTSGPLSVAMDAGQPFQYFDEVRKLVESAKEEVFFVDPWVDAEFVSRYLTQVSSGTRARLLIRKGVDAAVAAIDVLSKETGLQAEVRTDPGFHDRYLFVDRIQCFHSGASFKDGGVKAATTITQVVDPFDAVWATYERVWAAAVVRR